MPQGALADFRFVQSLSGPRRRLRVLGRHNMKEQAQPPLAGEVSKTRVKAFSRVAGIYGSLWTTYRDHRGRDGSNRLDKTRPSKDAKRDLRHARGWAKPDCVRIPMGP